MNKQRSAKFDNAKLILIFLVVLTHISVTLSKYSDLLAELKFWVRIFVMPGFILLAGLFSKRTVKERRWGKAVPYLFLYVFMMVLQYAWDLFNGEAGQGGMELLGTDSVAWFALAMFWWYAVTILCQRVHPAYVLTISILLSLVIGYVPAISEFLVLRRTIVFYPFFYVGYVMDPWALEEYAGKTSRKVFSLLILAATLLASVFFYARVECWEKLFRGHVVYSDLNPGFSWAWGWTWRLGFYGIAFIVAMALIICAPAKKTFLSGVGTRTLSVYALHRVVLYVLLSIGPVDCWIKGGFTAGKAILVSIVLVFVLSFPIFDWPLRKLMTVPIRRMPEEKK